jgi:hypothetical protein
MAHNSWILNPTDDNVIRGEWKTYTCNYIKVNHLECLWNLNYGNEIVLYEIHQFQNRVPNQMVTILLLEKYTVGRRYVYATMWICI